MKKIMLPILVILSIFFISFYSPILSKNLKGKINFSQSFVKGRIVKVINEELMEDPVIKGKFRGGQNLEVEILNGEHKGEIFKIYNSLSTLHNVYGYVGLEAIFTIKKENGKINVWLYNLKRDNTLYFLGVVFVGIIIFLGKLKGVKSLLSLAFTWTIIIHVLIPLLFKGLDPISTSIFLSSIIIVISFLLIGGYDKKTLSAILGTIFGITIAGFISYSFGKIIDLSGLHLPEGQQLLYITRDFKLKIDGLLFVAILIASLGAVMDVAMSMSSSINEIYRHKKTLTSMELFSSSMVIGKDIIGTMVNTLILAFTGSSLPLIMMIWGYGMVYQQFINIPTISIEILNALAGSIGIIATVPITAIISILLIKNGGKKNEKN